MGFLLLLFLCVESIMNILEAWCSCTLLRIQQRFCVLKGSLGQSPVEGLPI